MSAPDREGAADPLSAVRSIVGRVATTATLIAVAAVAILYFVTWSVTSAGLTRALAVGVDADLAGLADIYATSGRGELIARMNDRRSLVASDGGQAHYLLLGPTGRLAGDVAALPPTIRRAPFAGYTEIAGRPVYARRTRLGPDLDLLVAREYAPERAILARLSITFAAAGLLIVLAVLAMAWSRSRQLARRLAAINDAYRRDDAGAIATLVGDARRDEIGELARRSGLALARVHRLLDAQRGASDHVAHELRTPLLHLETRLRGLMRAVPAAPVAETVTLASRDIRRITDMLDSLLDIAASEANRGSSQGMVEVDLTTLADDLAEVYRASMEEAGLRLSSAIDEGVVMRGEPAQIGRMIANLLDNAVKYVPAGGTVRLAVSDGPVIVVEDDGPGIDPVLAPHVFERFKRGPDTDGRPGHGLGLALAQAIAHRHELVLSLTTGPGGSRFRAAPLEAAA